MIFSNNLGAWIYDSRLNVITAFNDTESGRIWIRS
ncbi:hypothetical protein NMY3_00223 [Candidatus Nitrosocosmicus oleophilus]|uniref:Uncharacterized protein n=1 Tax=Candidatus Nitrosocosmicus oleophilus TaxID=1353260 RepID=A0A654LTS7_9ARCH|nr:hypothetical protein NMY3_00223 [Candidatus Nitrosocosmicus oleophilus]